MKGLINFFKQIVTAHSGVSSKRFCGVLGWIIAIGILIYCTINIIQAPTMIDIFMVCCMALLGIDSFTGIWKK